MSLLAGIIGQTKETPNLNTSITSYVERINTTSGMTITGANDGQLYILCHNAYNLGGISNAPATPSGFTSLSSYGESGNIFSFRLSYKILTSNEATYTLPSVSGANGQVATGLVVNTLSGTFAGLSIENSLGYSYSTSTSASGNLITDINSILIGFGLLYDGLASNSGVNLPTPAVGAAQTGITSGGATQDDYYSVVHAKNYTDFGNDTWSANRDSSTTILTNTFNLKPTFS
jgi:hypothetical protein